MNGEKLARIRLSFTQNTQYRASFERQTVLQPVTEFGRFCVNGKVKNSSGQKFSGPVEGWRPKILNFLASDKLLCSLTTVLRRVILFRELVPLIDVSG